MPNTCGNWIARHEKGKLMARNFRELQAKMSPERRARNEEWAEAEMAKIRRSRDLTQEALAERLGTDQGSVSRLEKQADMHLSTLRNYVEAAGGRLELLAVFPDETLSVKLG